MTHDAFAIMFGSGRGLRGGGPAVLHDADVIRAFIAGRQAHSPRYAIRTYPDGPDPSACFLVDAQSVCDNPGRGHGIVAARWSDTDGSLNFATSPQFDDALYAPIGARCAQGDARPLLTTTWQLGLDEDFASGVRPDLRKEDRCGPSSPYPREGEHWTKVSPQDRTPS